MSELFAIPALIAYALLNIFGPYFAVRRMKERQSSEDVSIPWQLCVLFAVLIFLGYSVERNDPVFVFGQIANILALSLILLVIVYYRRR